MGDIKSTIDLIMERTRGMTLSAEERADLRHEEFHRRAKGFRLRLLEDPSKASEVLSGINEESPDDKKLLEALMWKELVENLPANEELSHHLDVLQVLPQATTKGRALGELRSFLKGGMKNSAEDRKKVITRERKKLAAQGISGTAVVPKILKESDPSEELLAAIATCKAQLL